jgi:hypothetical protein
LHAFIPVLRCDADFENVEKKDNVDIFIDPNLLLILLTPPGNGGQGCTSEGSFLKLA